MQEVWFDTRLGEQLIGEDAALQRLQESSPGDVAPLQELLLSDDFPVATREFRKQVSSQWSREDFVALGSAMLNLFESTGYDCVITTRVLNRLQKLGIGPLLRTFIGKGKDFETMQDYRQAVGTNEVGYSTRGKFDSWTTSDYIRYAASLERQIGGKPRMPDYERRSREDRNAPTISVLTGFFTGGISELNEHLGYCNTKSWSADDYIDFGAKYVEVNGPDMFKHGGIMVLSGRRRGPGYAAIMRQFGTWKNYKSQVLAEHEERSMAAKEDRREKLARYQAMINNGQLPEDYSKLSDDQLLFCGARHLVARRVAPGISASNLQVAIQAKASRIFVRNLIRYSHLPNLTAGSIELEAALLGVYDDLWPTDRYKKYLRVSQHEIDVANARRNATKRDWWSRTRTHSNPNEPAV
ncbi:MAG TPA: hypothetical protein VFT16_01430 [Candidatus Saccharimonadales bacterium]|nr:hypothetical protein [Candidatus Saccharimonadales bacterium]